MDFLEHWLGFSPDGGNGTLEVLLLVVLASGPVALARWRVRRQQRQRRR